MPVVEQEHDVEVAAVAQLLAAQLAVGHDREARILAMALLEVLPGPADGDVEYRIGECREVVGDLLSLSVADNGVGLPADAAGPQGRSLGVRLMHALASQLDGRVEFHDANPGTEVRLVVEKPDVRD